MRGIEMDRLKLLMLIKTFYLALCLLFALGLSGWLIVMLFIDEVPPLI
jgi:hypothetical protein